MRAPLFDWKIWTKHTVQHKVAPNSDGWIGRCGGRVAWHTHMTCHTSYQHRQCNWLCWEKRSEKKSAPTVRIIFNFGIECCWVSLIPCTTCDRSLLDIEISRVKWMVTASFVRWKRMNVSYFVRLNHFDWWFVAGSDQCPIVLTHIYAALYATHSQFPTQRKHKVPELKRKKIS